MFLRYLNHYIAFPGMVLFLAVTTGVVIAAMSVCLAVGIRKSKQYYPEDQFDAAMSYAERFSELIFSSTAVLGFVSVYSLINLFETDPAALEVWNKWKDFLLLLFLALAVGLNSFFDHVIVPLRHLTTRERSGIRMIGMLYMLVIFAYIKFIYNDDNYDRIILYFLTLVIGRFVYFDVSISDAAGAVKDAASNIPYLLLALGCTGVLAWYGFGTGYLLKSNSVVMSLFIAHLFMVTVIFILMRTRIVARIVIKRLPGSQ